MSCCCCNTNGSSGSEHNRLIGIQGGNTAERFHLTSTAHDISERFSFDAGGGLLFDGQPVATAMLDSGIPITVMNAGEFSVETDMTGVISEGALIRINNKFMKVVTSVFNEAPNLGVNVITVFPEILLPIDNGKNLEVSSLSQSSLNVEEVSTIVNNVINSTLPANIIDALNAASVPSTSNPFVTESAMRQALIDGGVAPDNIDILENIGEDGHGNPTWKGDSWPGDGTGDGGWNPDNKNTLAKIGEDATGEVTFGGKTLTSMVNGVPMGVITAWYGLSSKVPSGWVICDGTNGTPDLRGRTLIGVKGTDAAADASVGTAAGVAGNLLSLNTNNMPNHSHAILSSGSNNTFSGSAAFNGKTRENVGKHQHTSMFRSALGVLYQGAGQIFEFLVTAEKSVSQSVDVSKPTGYENSSHYHGIDSQSAQVTVSGTVALSGNTSASGQGLPVDITPAARRLHYIMKV